MSKIPYTGKSPGARQPIQQPLADPLAPAENLPAERPLLEDPDALAARLAESEDFVRRNRGILLGLLGLVVAAIVGGFGFYTWRNSQNQKAQSAMFQAVNYWEADSLRKATSGDGKAPGLETIADQYGSTKAGNLANFYAGVAALKQGKFQEALDDLEDFSSDDYLVQARAYTLMGDAQLELGKPKEAADLYAKAADHNANEFFSPGYLLKEALAREEAKDVAGARKAYDRILTEYAAAAEAAEAKSARARLGE
ncbi:tetratricopeptide repeat protein [uncultured Hymenobacter sp.]|uniref:tetratricopeptide repeat protein n=1 Tax=uncultured Hymenobacter sp. TaxID=170016 RepID=UPI0035CAA8A2